MGTRAMGGCKIWGGYIKMTTNKVTLSDIYEVVNRLEDKMDKRMSDLENRVNVLESFRDNLIGKIAAFSAIVAVSITMLWDWVKSKLR